MRKNTIAVAMLSIFLASFLLLSTKVSADADEIIDRIELSVPVACTMGGTGTTSHNATIDPGTYSGASGSDYENGIGKTVLTSFCNDANGFAIYAIGYTGDSYDSENHTKLVGVNTSQTIATKVYASGDTSSNWSMKLTKVTDSTESYLPANMSILGSFDNWHTVPASYTKVAEYHSSTTNPSTTDTILGAKLETTYATYISTTQVADTYNGQVKYTMVHPYTEQPLQPQSTPAGCINYYPNGSNVEGTMGCQSISSNATSATLLASNFSRTGYGFAGWSDKFDYATNPEAKFYGPNETISFTAGQYTGSNNGLSLYSVWIESEGSIQDQSIVASVCSSLTTAPTNGTANLTSVSALTDQRDNNTYAIAKLADGKCWMIENLRLDNTADHNSDGALAQGYGTGTTYGNFMGLANPESANFEDSTTANSLYYSGTQSGTASIDIGTNNASTRMPRYNNVNTQSRAQNPAPTSNGSRMYSYGNYYTWHAAVANTSYYPTGDGPSFTSICPRGWKLPQGDTTSAGFGKLDIDMGGNGGYQDGAEASNRWRKYPANFLYSGDFERNVDYGKGHEGYYWSYTSDGTYHSRGLELNEYASIPRIGTSKSFGQSIRCVVGY